MNSAPETSRAARPAKKRVMSGPLRNIVWALLLTMAVVVVIGVGFFDVGSQQDLERTTLPNAEVDVAESAGRAQDLAEFPVVVPEVEADGWTPRSARFTSSPEQRWEVRYSAPSGVLVTLLETQQISADAQESAVPGTREADTFELEGASCALLEGSGENEGQRAIRCEGDGFGVLVHGQSERAELEQLMTAALVSAGSAEAA